MCSLPTIGSVLRQLHRNQLVLTFDLTDAHYMLRLASGPAQRMCTFNVPISPPTAQRSSDKRKHGLRGARWGSTRVFTCGF